MIDQNKKQELKNIGKTLRADGRESAVQFRAEIREQADSREKKRSSIFEMLSGYRHITLPLASVMGVIILMIVVTPNSPRVYPDYIDPVAQPMVDDGYERMVAEDLVEFDEEAIDLGLPTTSNSGFLAMPVPRPETKKVSQGEIDGFRDEHGDYFDESYNVSIMSKKESVFEDVTQLFTSLDGYVSQMSSYSEHSKAITGRVPAESIEFFRTELRDYVGSSDFIRESSYLENRVDDAIIFDRKISDTETAIAELEEKIANENNAIKRASLESELKRQQNLLESRQFDKENLIENVIYVDVSLNIEKIKGWSGARTYWELEQSFAGYETPSIMDLILINILYIISQFLIVFSYSFWILIPLIIWWVGSKKRRKVFKELD